MHDTLPTHVNNFRHVREQSLFMLSSEHLSHFLVWGPFQIIYWSIVLLRCIISVRSIRVSLVLKFRLIQTKYLYCNKMKKKKPSHYGNISNIKIKSLKDSKLIPLAHKYNVHVQSLSWLGIDVSITCCEVKLVLWAPTSRLSKMLLIDWII